MSVRRSAVLTGMVLCFTWITGPAKAAEPRGGALAPPSGALPGWSLTEEPAQFPSEELWRHINGAAEQYLKYGCESLTVCYYSLEGTESEIALEIYRMADEVGSFGIYALERPPEGPFLALGAQGYQSGSELNFFGGSFYIKLRTYPDGDSERQAAHKLAQVIADEHLADCEFPETLSRFPRQDLQESSLGLVPRAVLGLTGLRNAFSATYRREESELTLFLARESSAEAAEGAAAAAQASLVKRSKGPLQPIGIGALQGHRADLRYHGPVLILRRGADVLIAKGAFEADWGQVVLFSLLENLSD